MSRGGAAIAGSQRVVRGNRRSLPRGKRTKDKSGGETQGGGENKHSRVERNGEELRNHSCTEYDRKFGGDGCERDSGSAAEAREGETLDQHLTDNLGTAGADGGTNRKFILAANGASQEQIRNVRACDQEQEADCTGKHEKRRTESRRKIVVKTGYTNADGRIVIRKLRGKTPVDEAEIRLRGL